MKKRLLSSILVGLAVLTGCVAPAMADSRKVVTLGADLTPEQQNTMMRYFGVSRDAVDLIYINNDDEREHLGSYVPLEQIGTRTFSCALVAPTRSGGIQVKTANLSWVTCNMIASTLSTSGVTNCQVVAASPFEVSGTGALTGVIMAYETASEQQLDPVKKELANEELVTTGNLADEVGQSKATAVINETKLQVIENNITDMNEIHNIVNNVSNSYDVTISEDQSEEIAVMMQKIAAQEYDITQLKATLERVQANVAGDAGASEEEQQKIEEQAKAAEEAAREAAQVVEPDLNNGENIILIENGEVPDGVGEEENILENTDISALEADGIKAEEGTTTQTVQEQIETAQTENVIDLGGTEEFVYEVPADEIQVVDAPADTQEAPAAEVPADMPEAEVPVVEVPAEVPEAADEATDKADVEMPEIIETEEVISEDELDELDRSVYDEIKREITAAFEQNQVTSDDGSVVYLTEDAAKKTPEAIVQYVLKVFVKGVDEIAAKEAADPEIPFDIIEETRDLAEDKDYDDEDLKQIDQYVRRLVLKDSEDLLADSQLEDYDSYAIYTKVMKIMEKAFGVEVDFEEEPEEVMEVIDEQEEFPEDEYEEFIDGDGESFEGSLDDGGEFAEFVEEEATFQ